MTRFIETTLVSSTGNIKKLPPPTLPEVAFAGRSNVGKSSLLNAISNRKNLFKVSKSPGRTRTIIHVKGRLDKGAEIYLVDLPGFGYAKVSKGMTNAWATTIEGYLKERTTLHMVCILVDIRRGLQDEERELCSFLAQLSVPSLLIATKLDRVPKNKQGGLLEKLKRESGTDVLGTSSTTKDGIDRVCRTIATACGYP